MTNFVNVTKNEGIATLTLSRGKVNALNERLVEQLKTCFEGLKNDPEISVIILTGQGKFFSFGFDIPEFLGYPRKDFTSYLTKFTDLLKYIFLFPKPVIVSINGHAIAGGCMLATTGDYRIMVADHAKISLNEISFGATVFASSVAILKYCTGSRNAETILYSGAMYSPDQAMELGLIDRMVPAEKLLDTVDEIGREFAQKDPNAFSSLKGLLRKPVLEGINKSERDSIREFTGIWYTETTWAQLQKIMIHS